MLGLCAASVVTVDEMVLCHGSHAVLGASRLASLEPGGATHGRDAAMPTTGTSRAGDIV